MSYAAYSHFNQQQRLHRAHQGPVSYAAYPGQPLAWNHHSSRSFSAGSIYYPPRPVSPSPSAVNGYPRSRSVSGTDSFRNSAPPMNSSSVSAGSVPDRYHRHRPSLRSSPSVKSFDFDSTSTQTSNTSSSGSLPDENPKHANVQQVREALNLPATQSMPNLSQPKSRSNSPTKTPRQVKSVTPPSSVSSPTAAFQPIQPKWARAPSPPEPMTQPLVQRAEAPARRQQAKQGPLVLPSDMRVRHSISLGTLSLDEGRRGSMVYEAEPTASRAPSIEALRGPMPVAKLPPVPRSMYNSHMLTPEVSPKTQSRGDAETRSLQPGRASVRPMQPKRPASVLGVPGESKIVANAPAPAPASASAPAKPTLKKSRSFGDRLRSLFGSGKPTPTSAPATKAPAPKSSRKPARTLGASQSFQELKSDAASITSVKSSMSTLSMTSMRKMFKRKEKSVSASPSFEVLTPPMTLKEQQQHVESQQRHHFRNRIRGSQSKIDYTPRSYRNSMGAPRPGSVSSINSLGESKPDSISPGSSPVQTANIHARPVSMAFGDALSPNTSDIAAFSDADVPETRSPTPLPALAKTEQSQLENDDGLDLTAASSTVFPRSLDAEGVANILSSLDVPHRELSRKSSRRSNRSAKEREEEAVPDPQEIYVGSPSDELKSLETFSFPSAMDSLDLFHPALEVEPLRLQAFTIPEGPHTRSSLRKSSKSAPRRHKVAFSSRIVVYDTYAETDYDRTPEEATCHRLSTPGLAHQIKQELNSFKVQMEVHEQSRAYTHYFRD